MARIPYVEHCCQKRRARRPGRALWGALLDAPAHLCPWKVGVAPMLSLILRKQGSHD